jgi:hypothetical protein
MKKWFEWQQKNQHVDSDSTSFIIDNVKDQCNIIMDWVLKNSDKFVETHFYGQNNYTEKLLKSYPELSHDEVEQWILDSQFDFLLKETAKFEEIKVPWDVFLDFSNQCKDLFSIDKTGSEIIVTKQKPGQTSPIHYDRKKYSDYGLDDQREKNIKRWLIMLEDQHPGQCFLMNNTYLSWKQGDVISWENTELPHGAANFGFYDRYTLRITGKLVKEIT